MWGLHYAQATLIAGGFAQIYGDADNRTIVVSDTRHLTEGQRKTLQNEIYDAISCGNDVTIKTLSGKATTLLEEDDYNIAKIHGWLVRNGDFSHGQADRQRDVEEAFQSHTREIKKERLYDAWER